MGMRLRLSLLVGTVCVGLAAVAGLAYRAAGRVEGAVQNVAALRDVPRAGRPDGRALWTYYAPVCYADHNSGAGLQAAWRSIGGSVGAEGGRQQWLPCAAELSYALDRAGAPIPPVRGASNRNSDGRRYILSARLMRRYLRSRWGRPDLPGYDVQGCQPSSAAFLHALGLGDRLAVFASDSHVGVIKTGYSDPYLPYLATADIWILPVS